MRQVYYDLGILFKMINIRLKARIDEHFKEIDLTTTQARALRYFFEHGDCSHRDFERISGLSHSTVSGLIDRLEDKGYLKTSREGRNRMIKTTEKKLEFKSFIDKSIEENNKQMVTGMGAEEQRLLHELLLKVLANLEKED